MSVIFPYFGLLLTLAVCGGAFWKGARDEQLAAGGLLIGWAATIALRDRNWIGTQWATFGVDIGFFAVLLGIALTSKKFWPLFAAAFQLLAVVTHVGRTLDDHVKAWAYATAAVIWTQLVVVTIGVGAINTWRASRFAQPAETAAPTPAAGATRR